MSEIDRAAKSACSDARSAKFPHNICEIPRDGLGMVYTRYATISRAAFAIDISPGVTARSLYALRIGSLNDQRPINNRLI